MSNARKYGPLTVREHVRKGVPTGSWMLDIPANLTGTRKRMRRFYSTRKTAEDIARGLRKKLELRKLGFVEAKGQSALSFASAAEDWRADRQIAATASHIRSSSLRTIYTRLKPLGAYFGNRDIAVISSTDIMSYQAHRIEAKRKASTVNGEVRVLRQLLGWCLERGHIGQIPKCKLIRENQPKRDVPTTEEVVRLIDALRPPHNVLVWLMGETGLRPAEALNLPWRHIDLENGVIQIDEYGGWKPKTQTSVRSVHPSPELLDAIRHLPRRGEFVFAGRKPGLPLVNIRASLSGAAKRTGLSIRPTAKTFRKFFATRQAERGVPLPIVQRQMGHSPGSKVTSEHYIRVSDDAQRLHRLSLRPDQSRDAA